MIGKEELGKLIQEKRKEKGMTQQELAKKICVTDKAISNWETGKNYPDLTYLQDLNIILDLNISETLVGKRKKEKRFKQLCILLILTLFVVSCFLTFYYYKYKNRYIVYEITTTEDCKIENGMVFINNKKIIIKMGMIVSNRIMNNTSIDASLSINDEIDIFYRKNFSSIDLTFSLSNKDYKIIKENINKMILKVNYINLEGKQDMISIPLILNEVFEERIVSDVKINNKKILLANNGYKEVGKNYYEKHKMIKNYTVILGYSIDENKFFYEYTNEDTNYKFTLNDYENILEVEIIKMNLINSTIENFKYEIDKDNLICNIGNCKNYKDILNLVKQEYLYLKN